MTTEAAAAYYLERHNTEVAGGTVTVFNPHGKPLEGLPVIYGFNNSGTPGLLSAVALAEDGVCLGQHGCSDEGYMSHDLGILKGSRPDRHVESYQKHYPGGYQMEFVPSDRIDGHPGLSIALKNAEQKLKLEEPTNAAR